MASPATRATIRTRPLWLVATLTLTLGTSVAVAANWPSFKPGQWQFDRTVSGIGSKPQKFSRTDCVDPTAEQKRQRDMLTKAGCKFTPLTQSGNSYRYTATCKVAGMNSTSNSVLEVKNAEAYTLTVDSINDGAKSHEVLIARRLGDCPK